MKYEALILAKLNEINTPGAPKLLGIRHLKDQKAGILMPMYRTDLLQELQKKGPLPLSSVLRYGSQVLAVL